MRRSTTAGSARLITSCASGTGHVLVAMGDHYAVITNQFPRELNLVGMHGSLTPEEMLIPLFCD